MPRGNDQYTTSNVNQADNHGKYPLFWAVNRANIDQMVELITLGANVHAIDNNGFSALYWAIKHHAIEKNKNNKKIYHEMIKYLVERELCKIDDLCIKWAVNEIKDYLRLQKFLSFSDTQTLFFNARTNGVSLSNTATTVSNTITS